MDYLTFIATLVQAVAWPITVGILVYLFRLPIAYRITALRSLKMKGIEAVFGEGLKEIESEADKARLPPPNEVKLLPAPPDDPLDKIRQLAAVSPPAAIVEAWRLVERAAAYLFEHREGKPTKSIMEFHGMMRQLLDSKQIELSLYNMYQQLRQLRNLAVHDHLHAISAFEAVNYGELAVRVAEALIALAQKPKSE
jgi:hypothetical protein